MRYLAKRQSTRIGRNARRLGVMLAATMVAVIGFAAPAMAKEATDGSGNFSKYSPGGTRLGGGNFTWWATLTNHDEDNYQSIILHPEIEYSVGPHTKQVRIRPVLDCHRDRFETVINKELIVGDLYVKNNPVENRLYNVGDPSQYYVGFPNSSAEYSCNVVRIRIYVVFVGDSDEEYQLEAIDYGRFVSVS